MRPLALFALFLSVSCSLGAAPSPTVFPTATTVRSGPVTLVPTVGRLASTVQPHPAPADATTAPAQPTPTGCTLPDDPTLAHTVRADIDYGARRVTVAQSIRYVNAANEALPVLLLNVEPNRWLDTFTLDALLVDGEAGRYTLTGRRLEVVPPSALEPGCSVTLDLAFVFDLPPVIGGPEAFRGYFGETPRQLNLGHWLPTVVPYRDGDWLYQDTILIGEQVVLDPAHWDVTFTVQNAPEGVLVAAPGQPEMLSPNAWRFVHTDGREFAASLSHVFRVSRETTVEGVEVEVYTMPDATVSDQNGSWIDSGVFAAQVTAESLSLYIDRYGPYPHERMVIVQGDFPDGMEFSGFAFVSTDWFKAYNGDPAGYLLLITVHEVAHQWWYDRVGSNQALAPWLDEALSTYSEYVYIEAHHPDLADWWWYFRVNRLNPQGVVDSTVYEFDAIRPYINAVYLRGVLMLHEMRLTLGDEAFFEWLTAYAEANAGGIAGADDLWAALTPEQFEQTAFTRVNFLRSPGVR